MSSGAALATDRTTQGAAVALPDPGAPLVTGLPGLISANDAELYQEIFALQKKGRLRAADKLIAQLDDRLLMGQVLYQRYMHPTAYRSRYKELKAWLAEYADHPGADKIYKLALRRRPANHRYPVKPTTARLKLSVPVDPSYRSSRKRSTAESRRVRQFKRKIRRNILRTRLSTTEKLLASAEIKRLFDQAERDWGYAQVARGWYFHGKTERALKIAHAAAERSGDKVPEAHWFAGLAAWRLGKVADAVAHFEAVARSPHSSSWTAAAGAYWAARSHLRLRQPAEVSHWLRIAASHSRSFYGLVAASALGIEPNLDFGRGTHGREQVARLEAIPAGKRVLALLQIGETRRAEQELLFFGNQSDPAVIEALLLLASEARLPALALRLGRGLAAREDFLGSQGALDAALYPIPPWQPHDGFKLDRALVFALIRQESAFNPRAKSRDGARGLMQIMPGTASYVDRGTRYRGRARDLLLEPGLNLKLGQRYLAYLLEHPQVSGDLFRLATAYNGGPGNLAKWQRKMGISDDPLLFIESLPSRETRLFIEKVLANFWIYRQRLGQGAPSREDIATGTWPRYRALDVERSGMARSEVLDDEQN